MVLGLDFLKSSQLTIEFKELDNPLENIEVEATDEEENKTNKFN